MPKISRLTSTYYLLRHSLTTKAHKNWIVTEVKIEIKIKTIQKKQKIFADCTHMHSRHFAKGNIFNFSKCFLLQNDGNAYVCNQQRFFVFFELLFLIYRKTISKIMIPTKDNF